METQIILDKNDPNFRWVPDVQSPCWVPYNDGMTVGARNVLTGEIAGYFVSIDYPGYFVTGDGLVPIDTCNVPQPQQEWWNVPFDGDVDLYNILVLSAICADDMIGSTGMFKTGWWQYLLAKHNISQDTQASVVNHLNAIIQQRFYAEENAVLEGPFGFNTDDYAQHFGLPRRVMLALQRAILGVMVTQDVIYLGGITPEYFNQLVNGQGGFVYLSQHPKGSHYSGDFNLGDPANWAAIILALPTGGVSLFGMGLLTGGAVIGGTSAFGGGLLSGGGWNVGGIVETSASVGEVLAQSGNLTISIGGKDITAVLLDAVTSGRYSADVALKKMVDDINNGTFTLADIGQFMNKVNGNAAWMLDIGNITIGESATNIIKGIVIALVMLYASGAITALVNGKLTPTQALAISKFGVSSYVAGSQIPDVINNNGNQLPDPTSVGGQTTGNTVQGSGTNTGQTGQNQQPVSGTVVDPVTGNIVDAQTGQVVQVNPNNQSSEGVGMGIGVLAALGAWIMMQR